MRIRGFASAWRAVNRAISERLPLQAATCFRAPVDLRSFSSAAGHGIRSERIAAPLHGPRTCHSAAVHARTFSLAAYPIREERLAAPLHRLLGEPFPRRFPASTRSFSSGREEEIHRLLAQPFSPRVAGFSSGREEEIISPYEEVIRPCKGIIRPDHGYYRPRAADGPRLPIVTQTSFHQEQDVHLTGWETPMDFINRRPLLVPAGKGNPLIYDRDAHVMMLSYAGRILAKSAVDLVSSNRHRGYCISRALVEDNLAVSVVHGTFGLRRPIADDLPDDSDDFVGFKALKRLFLNLITKSNGSSVILLSDVGDWLDTLDKPDFLDGLIPTYHACMLPDEGRAWLSVRIAQILSVELNYADKEKADKVFEHLYPQSLHLSKMHPFFNEWLTHSAILKDIMSQGLYGSDLPSENSEKIAGGRSVVMMNRNGILHSHNKKLSSLARKGYSTKNVVDLLHCKLPLYLPSAQEAFWDNELWRMLDVDRFFPKKVIYPRMKEMQRK